MGKIKDGDSAALLGAGRRARLGLGRGEVVGVAKGVAKLAFLFPGQGSQKVGMGRALHDAHAAARAVFDEADAALGFRSRGSASRAPRPSSR